jgi:hypothetical protein
MTDQQATSSTARTGASSSTELSDVVELVKSYARQETLGPLRGAGRWIAFGLAGAMFLGTAASLLVLGVLRLVQTEFAPTFSGRWMSLLPYLFAFVVCIAVIAFAAMRIGKKSLHED